MPIDLTVTPQQGRLTPGEHLSDDEAQQVMDDWAAPAAAPTPGGATWLVGFEHKDGQHYAITSTLTIPAYR